MAGRLTQMHGKAPSGNPIGRWHSVNAEVADPLAPMVSSVAVQRGMHVVLSCECCIATLHAVTVAP